MGSLIGQKVEGEMYHITFSENEDQKQDFYSLQSNKFNYGIMPTYYCWSSLAFEGFAATHYTEAFYRCLLGIT